MPSITQIDRRRTRAILCLASLAVATLGSAPGLETALRARLGLSTGQVGLLFLVELGGMALASWPCGRLLERWGPRWLARAALGAWSAANLLSIPALAQFEGLLACRAAAGLGAGAMMILALEGAGRGPRPQRTLAALVVAQLAVGAALLGALPALLDAGGLAAVFMLEALAGLLALGLAPPLAALPPADAAGGDRGLGHRDAWLVVAVALPFNAAIGALWSFVAEFAPQDRMPARHVDDVLSAGTLLGIAAAAAAGVAGRRWSPCRGAALGTTGLVAGTATIALWRQPAGFVAGAMLLSFAWNFAVPFLMNLGAPRGAGPSSMRAVNLAFAAGLAIGPPLGGWVFQAGGPVALASATVLACLLSLGSMAARQARAIDGRAVAGSPAVSTRDPVAGR
jgi:predicted MFS family arabinose efflux permease